VIAFSRRLLTSMTLRPADISDPFRSKTRARCLSSAKVVISNDRAAGAVIALVTP
jgi:hypothetical protein